MDDVVWSSSLDGRTILYINATSELVYGYTPAEFFENPNLWFDVIHPDDQEQVRQNSESLRLLGSKDFEYRIVRPDDEVRWLHDRAHVTYSAEGVPLRLDGIATDITERKQAEAEMQKALDREKELSELKSRFVSMSSHEFRTPLSTILLSAGMLERYSATWSEEKRQKHFLRIQGAVKHMTNLLDDVLLLGKAEAQKLNFVPTLLNLNEFCRDLIEEMRFSISDRRTLVFLEPPQVIPAYIDKKLLRSILSNLLSNAIKYSLEGGKIELELSSCQDNAIFHVRDQGIGIPLEDQKHLFESFYRARNVMNIPGTGLGLAIAKRCIDSHGGKVTVVSQPEIGTIFTVFLPLREPDRFSEQSESRI